MRKEFNTKEFKRTLARNGMFSSAWLFDKLPYCIVKGMMHLFIGLGFFFTVKQKRLAKESLDIAFGGEKSDEEIKQIIKKCFENFGRGMIEMLYFLSHPKLIGEKVTFEGMEHLEKAMSDGKGAVAVTAHFGNFPLMMLACVHRGFKCSSIIRPTRDPVMEEFLLKKRTAAGLNTVYALPRKKCVLESIKVLRNNEVLFVPLDQNFGSGKGVFVDFFGQKAATATGPVVFALRTKAPILPMFIVRVGDDKHKIIIEPPVELETLADEDGTIYQNTAKITKLIESYIRQYPHEWGWMHRRWKSKPSKQQSKEV